VTFSKSQILISYENVDFQQQMSQLLSRKNKRERERGERGR